MAVEKLRQYTVEEFEELADADENRDRLFELIDGEIVEKVPTEEHGRVIGNIYGPLWNHVRQHQTGRVVMEVRHRVATDRRNARIPDVSYISGKRAAVKKGSVPQMPDLVVEVKSPDDSLKAMRAKVRYYLANGVKLVWLVIPEKHWIEVYSLEEELVLGETDVLSGGAVLPGFSLPVRDVFTNPLISN